MSKQFCYDSGPIDFADSIIFTNYSGKKIVLKFRYKMTWAKVFTTIDCEKGGLVKWNVTKLLKLD